MSKSHDCIEPERIYEVIEVLREKVESIKEPWIYSVMFRVKVCVNIKEGYYPIPIEISPKEDEG